MPKYPNNSSTAVVTIGSVEINPIEVGGERVVTLAMIDEVHERASGTARKRFNDHRHRMEEGKHYFVRKTDEAAAMGITAPNGLTLLTERGYLMLVKSFTDDLAWQVQDMLVESYFTKPAAIAATTPQATTAIAREVRLTNSWLVSLAKASGITGNQALIAASQGTERMTGVNPLGLMGITYLPAPQNENLLSPRDIAHRIGDHASDRAVNLTLTRIGFQTASRDHKGKMYYEPTAAGIEAGGIMQDTGKQHSSGAPVRALRWASSIVRVVDEAMRQEYAA